MISLLWSLGVLAGPPQHSRVAAAPPAHWRDLSAEDVSVRLWWDAEPGVSSAVQVARGGQWHTLDLAAEPGWSSAPLPRGAALRVGNAGEWAEPVYVPTWVTPAGIARLSGPAGATLAGVVGQIDIDSHSGTLWASTLGGGLVSVSAAGEARSHTIWDGLPDDTVIALDAHGDRLLVGTAAGAVLFDGGDPVRVWDDSLPEVHAQAVLLTDDQVLVGTTGGPAEVFPTRVISDGPPAVYSMAPARGGGVWVGMTGLRHRDSDGGPVGEIRALDGDRIYAIHDREDGVWVASHEHGVRRGTPPALEAVEGMPSTAAYSLAFTADGPWAAAGDGGLIGPGGRGFGYADGLPGRSAWALAATDSGGLWVGTERGLAHLVPGPPDQPPRVHAVPLARWHVTESVSVVLPSGRGLWVGGERGVWALGEPHRATANLMVAGPKRVRAILEGGGYTWAIGERVVRMDRRGRLTSVPLRERVLSAAWSQDALWLGTWTGISRLDPTTMTVEPWLQFANVQRLWPTPQGFWALAGDEPVQVVGRMPRPFLLSHNVRDLAPMGAGVCLGTDDGVAYLSPDGDLVDPLGDADAGIAVPAVASGADGGCWYATDRGEVGRIAADDAHVQRVLPLHDDVRVRRIVADGDWAWLVTDRGTWRVWLPSP